MAVVSESTWGSRTAEGLPEGVVVVDEVAESVWYRPWTYISPFINRFVTVDVTSVRENPEIPGQRMVDLYFFGRWSPVNQAPMFFDCAENRSALLIDGAEFAPDGSLRDAQWETLAPSDSILTLACKV